MRVLIVEDDPAVSELLRRWLTGWGYVANSTASAADALESIMADPADIVLSDIRMPGQDGLWLLERVRANWPRTAVIMASGVLEMDAAEQAKRLGAVDFCYETLREGIVAPGVGARTRGGY